ncbi:hypothetical protein ABGB07_02095 [Micromonosporaceae bacterium B7E4]
MADPGRFVMAAEIVAVDPDQPGMYTVAVVECPCGGVVGECGCDEMVTDWLRRFEQMHRAGVAR